MLSLFFALVFWKKAFISGKRHGLVYLFPEIVWCPAQNLSVIFSVRRPVVAEGHDALGARDLELGVSAVEEPSVNVLIEFSI